ncbi:MAG: hypothetical protein MJ016_00885 [Victivallaceae bacterium]|nr:hypothetical protein [Victivallaceae bacterium]
MDVFEKSSPGEIKVIAVTGPTATGKTRLAVELARRFNGEIVSVDSRQVYRKLDLGTGKDREEYGEIVCRLIDVADPATEEYNLFRFLADAYRAVGEIDRSGKIPILCGGSALYLDALLRGYRLPGAARDHALPRGGRDPAQENSFAPPFALRALTLGVLYPREEVRRRIEERLDRRFASGMVGEVEQLVADGVSTEKLEYFGLEYREIGRFLQKKCDFSEMRQTLLDRIRQFAKRQDIFFRKMERAGVEIHWIERGDPARAAELAGLFLAGKPLPPVRFRLADFRNAPVRGGVKK